MISFFLCNFHFSIVPVHESVTVGSSTIREKERDLGSKYHCIAYIDVLDLIGEEEGKLASSRNSGTRRSYHFKEKIRNKETIREKETIKNKETCHFKEDF